MKRGSHQTREGARETRLAEARRIEQLVTDGQPKTRVAAATGIPRRTLYRRLDELKATRGGEKR